MVQQDIKVKLGVVCLETMRVFEHIKQTSHPKYFQDDVDNRLNELRQLLTMLEAEEVTADTLRHVARRLAQLNGGLAASSSTRK